DPPILAILHAKEIPSSKGGTMFADMRAAYDALPKTMKDRLSTLVGLHGRSTGPAGEKLYGDDKGETEKVYHEMQRPRCDRAPRDRSADPVRQPDAHAWFHRHDAGGSLAADRGTDRARDAGSFRLLPSLARRRCADVGRAGHDAPRSRRLSACGTPGHAAHDRVCTVE